MRRVRSTRVIQVNGELQLGGPLLRDVGDGDSVDDGVAVVVRRQLNEDAAHVPVCNT